MIGETKIPCLIRCKSAESLRRAVALAVDGIHPDREVTKTSRTYPGGVENRQISVFRIGDYFDKIELIYDTDDQMSFWLTFHLRQPTETSDWKYLLISTLRSISEPIPGVEALPALQPT